MERISNERYQEKAALRQASYARKKASATQAKGLIIVHTGRVIFDELNIVLRYDYLPLEEVLEELRSKREMLHVVITGRNAKEELMDMADLVTEMRLIKHPYKAGIKAQRGVEF
jgi:cob(I)alamin adenosyltransferase